MLAIAVGGSRSWRVGRVSGSSAGGLGPAGSVGLEGRVLAWLAAHSLGKEQLQESWISSGRVNAVGSQTARPAQLS